MREAEGYRPQLELLTDMFPGRAAITVNWTQREDIEHGEETTRRNRN